MLYGKKRGRTGLKGWFSFLLGIALILSFPVFAELKLPCDLTKYSYKPKLTISGENHRCQFCEIDKALRVADAARGKYLVGLEAVFPGDPTLKAKLTSTFASDPSRVLIFGIEDKFQYGLVTPVLTYHSIHSAEVKLREAFGQTKMGEAFLREQLMRLPDNKSNAENIVFILQINPYMKEAWAKVSRPFLNPREEEVAKLFDEFAVADKTDLEKRFSELPKTSAWYDYSAFLPVDKALGLAYLKLAKTTYQVPQSVLKNVAVAEDVFAGKDAGWDPFFNEMIVSWRNSGFASNILDLYCRAAEAGKDLFVIVGSLHVPGLQEQLRPHLPKDAIETFDPKAYRMKEMASLVDAIKSQPQDPIFCPSETKIFESEFKPGLFETRELTVAERKMRDIRGAKRKEWATAFKEKKIVHDVTKKLEEAKTLLPDSSRATVEIEASSLGLQINLKYPRQGFPVEIQPVESMPEIEKFAKELTAKFKPESTESTLLIIPNQRLRDYRQGDMRVIEVNFFPPDSLEEKIQHENY